jgi:hypothetical protein
MSFWKGVLSVGQALLNPAGAVIKAVQRDKVYEAAGAANSSLAPVSNITNRLDETSRYTAADLEALLNAKSSVDHGGGVMDFVQDNILLVAAGFLGLFFLMSKSRK